MTSDRPRLLPGPDHPIIVSPVGATVVVRHGPTVVARSERALELREASYPPVLYVPIQDVDGALLRDSDHHTYCPYKGEASYFDVVDGPEQLDAAVWYYPVPYPAVADIAGHVAFYPDRLRITVGEG